MNELGHGVTIFPVKGGYTNENQKMLMCVIPTREYYKLKEMLGINPKLETLINLEEK